MRLLWLVVLAGAPGCGDNAYPPGLPLAPASDVTIVAHQDDDLLFMQPDLHEAVRRGTGVTTVYVTAGDGGGGLAIAEDRERGLLRAYAGMAGSDDWFCGTLDLAAHTALHCRLATGAVSLVFLGYPDGGKQGERAASLAHLWDGSIPSAATIARHPTTYDRAGLIAAVAAVIDASAPATIRTLDGTASHGRDHADHQVTGALALVATAASSHHPR
ncbi:MAG: PIG-L family deacetylase, partial [Deltaproteobacteria bacterium]|nr:PIG-L family deacetylase [Deltaproteobacteria bacterium]